MVPSQLFGPEYKKYKHRKYHRAYHLLDNLQLPQIKRPAITAESHPVGRNLKNIFKKCNSPADQNNQEKVKLMKKT